MFALVLGAPKLKYLNCFRPWLELTFFIILSFCVTSRMFRLFCDWFHFFKEGEKQAATVATAHPSFFSLTVNIMLSLYIMRYYGFPLHISLLLFSVLFRFLLSLLFSLLYFVAWHLAVCCCQCSFTSRNDNVIVFVCATWAGWFFLLVCRPAHITDYS